MNETLLKQVKRKLNITWSDKDTDDRVSDIIAQAETVMLHKIGITDAAFDFSESGSSPRLYTGTVRLLGGIGDP